MLACQQWFVLEVVTVHCTRRGGWKSIRALMRQVWWQNFWRNRLMISKQTYFLRLFNHFLFCCGRGCWPWRGLLFQPETVENLGAIPLFRRAPLERLCAMPMCHWREALKWKNELGVGRLAEAGEDGAGSTSIRLQAHSKRKSLRECRQCVKLSKFTLVQFASTSSKTDHRSHHRMKNWYESSGKHFCHTKSICSQRRPLN